MDLKRCDKGHFYDGGKFQTCPHCAAAAGGDVQATMPYTDMGGGYHTAMAEPVTMPLYGQSQNQEPVTMPLYGQGQEPVTMPLYGQAQTQQPAATPSYGQAQDAEPLTVPMAQPAQPSVQESAAGNISLRDAVSKAVCAPEETPDEQKTVSLFHAKTGIDPVAGWLVCIEGEDFGGSFTVKSGRNFIGRAANMDIVLHGDNSISREKHAIILYEPKRREFIAQAGESRELFYLNDEVVLNPARLKQNDVLTIGNTRLMFFPCCGEEFSWDDFKKGEEEE